MRESLDASFTGEESGTGINLPGHGRTEKETAPSRNTDAYDRVDSIDGDYFKQSQMSSETAAFVRERRFLEERTIEWLEQEIISRFVSNMGGRSALGKDDYEKEAYQGNERDEPSTTDSSSSVDLPMGGEDSIHPSFVEALCQEILSERIASTVVKLKMEQSAVTSTAARTESPQPPPVPSPRKSIDFDQPIKERLPGYDESAYRSSPRASPVPPRVHHVDASSSTAYNPPPVQSTTNVFQLDKVQLMDIIRELTRKEEHHTTHSRGEHSSPESPQSFESKKSKLINFFYC
jgi:hypothetical protein